MYNIHRPTIKAEAKEFIRLGNQSVLGMSALYLVLSLLLTGADGLCLNIFGEGSASYLFVSVLISLISLVLSAGMICFCMGIRRGEVTPFSALFDGFGMAGKVILVNVLTGLFVALWSLFFLIPGIIAAYRYRFALYNVLENPDLSAMQAIALSKEQTYGMKMDLFELDMSFLGWALLTVISCGILSVWLAPYMQLADLGYYDIAKQRVSPFPAGENRADTDGWNDSWNA